jgi:hypothetical protein
MNATTTTEMTSLNSSDVNVTTSHPTVLLRHTAPSPLPTIVLLYVMMVFNVVGNGVTLAVIKTSQSLWNKTNYILASLTASCLVTGLSVLYLNAYLIFISFFTTNPCPCFANLCVCSTNPCKHRVLISLIGSFYAMPSYATALHLIVICVDQYVAIVHPFLYETKLTDRVIVMMIGAAWVVGALLGGSYAMWLIRINSPACPVMPRTYQIIDILLYGLVSIVIFAAYTKILHVAKIQRSKINAELATVTQSVSTRQPIPETAPSTASATVSYSIQSSVPRPVNIALFLTPSQVPRASQTPSNDNRNAAVEEQKEQAKKSRRQMNAIYLTRAVVGTYVLLWFPYKVGNCLQIAGYTWPWLDDYVIITVGIGLFKSAFNWVLYGAINKPFRRAYVKFLKKYCTCNRD